MNKILRSFGVLAVVAGSASLSGCFLLAAAGVGAAGGYEAKKNGYDVRSPVKKDTAGGYKGQDPVTKQPPANNTASGSTTTSDTTTSDTSTSNTGAGQTTTTNP